MAKTLFNGIAAVMAGFVAILLLSLVVDYGFLKMGILSADMPNTGKLLLSVGKEFIIGILGAWFTIWLGKKHDLAHAIALAIVMTAVVLIPVSSKWQQNPLWFSLAMMALPLLYALTAVAVNRAMKK